MFSVDRIGETKMAEEAAAMHEGTTAARPVASRQSRLSVQSILARFSPRRISAVYLWAFFLVVFGLTQGSTFLTATTFRLVFSGGAITCTLALAFMVPLIAGVFDLAIGALMSLSLLIAVWMSLHSHVPMELTAILCVLVCAAVGAVSGFVVVKLKVDSLIATLGMSELLLGLAVLMSDNKQLPGNFSATWSKLGYGSYWGIPIVDVCLLVIAVLIWFILEHHRVGRHLIATGSNAEAARLAGVRTDRIKWGSLVASGAIAGLAGILASASVGTWDQSVGPGYLFPAVAASFLGASQLRGRPNVWGTIIAYFALAFGIQGLTLTSTTGTVWSKPVFYGLGLILAVAFASRPAVQRGRRTMAAGRAARG
jgi:ribose transport system permease protein